jgi:hypothetical protein
MTEEDHRALEVLAEHALPVDAPGAWIREAIALMAAQESPATGRSIGTHARRGTE